MAEKYLLKFYYDFGSMPLWCLNERAFQTFGGGNLDLEKLGLSSKTIAEAKRLSDWHLTSLNQSYPPDPSPWRQEECDRFNEAARKLCDKMQQELGTEFDIDFWINYSEDPDLDEYLKDPDNFKRKD